MKKIILSAMAILAVGFASAQDKDTSEGVKGFAKGDVFMSGSVGISSTKTGDVKSNSFTISPGVGFFVTENIAIGGILGFTSSTSDQDMGAGLVEVKSDTFSVGAFGRYYTTPSSDFSFYGQLGVAYATSKSEVEGLGESKFNGFGIALSPGVSYFISKNFALEASIGALSYSSVKPDADGAESSNSFDLNLNLNDINLGLVYKF